MIGTAEKHALLAACPIAKGARVTRKGGGNQGTVVGRTTARDRRGSLVVICRVRWDRDEGYASRWGSAVVYGEVRAYLLEILG